jgi:glutaredoxin
MNIEIYTKQNCVFCTKLKNLLRAKNMNFTEMKLNEDYTREFLLEKYPNIRTYPVVVVDGFMIGGYTEFSNMVILEEQRQNSQKLLNEGI